MAVGMAMAEKHLAAIYNRPGFEVVDHHTYVLCGDGDLMEGVSHEACRAGRNAGPGQADRLLRRQPDLARRPHRAELHRRRAGALRGLSLARAARGGRQRPRRHRSRHRSRQGGDRQALAHRRAHHHRLRQPQGRNQQGSRRSAGRGGYCRDQEVLRLPRGPELLRARRRAGQLAQGRRSRRSLEAEWNKLFAGYAGAIPTWPPSSSAPRRASCKAGWENAIPSFPAGKPVATRNAGRRGDERHRRTSAGAVRRRCRPDRLHQDHLQARRELPRRPRRPQRLLRRARVRHVRRGQRHGRSRRAGPLRIDLLRLLRLLQAGDAAGGAHAGPLAVRLYPRLHRPGRRRPHAPARRAPDGAARRPAASPTSAPQTPTKPPPAGAWRSSARAPASSRSAARTCRSSTPPRTMPTPT